MLYDGENVSETIASAPEFAANADWRRLSDGVAPQVSLCARQLGRLMQLFFQDTALVDEWDQFDRHTVRAAKNYALERVLAMGTSVDTAKRAFELLEDGWRYGHLLEAQLI